MTEVQGSPGRRQGRSARVLMGQVSPPDLPGVVTLERALREALVTGAYATRFRREWRMGRMTSQGQVIVGRIGYGTDDTVDIWDEERQDFRQAAVPLGQTSPFALNVSTGRIVFQRRTTISAGSFTGAFALLLNISSSYLGWGVDVDETPESFAEFVDSVDSVQRLTITMRPQNPNYRGRRTVQHLIEGAQTAMAQLTLTGESINTADDVVAQAIDHALEYGKVTAMALRRRSRVPWTSDKRGALEERAVPVDPSTGDADLQALAREVAPEE